MAEITSGKDLTVLVLTADEANYLALALHEMMTDEGRVLVDEGPLYSVYDALVSVEDVE